MDEKNSKFSVIEIVFILGLLAMIAAYLLIIPGVFGPSKPSRAPSKALLRTIAVALQAYSADFNGLYPPDDCESTQAGFCGGKVKIKNSAHALCVYLTANNMAMDGRLSGEYLPFGSENVFNRNKNTFSFNYAYPGGEVMITGTDDYVVDEFGTPVVYDERKSEKDNDGLNPESFVLISGSKKDIRENITLKDLDTGDLSMFPEERMINIDSKPSDYKDTIPSYNRQDNDDIFE